MYYQNISVFRTQDIQNNRESLKYSLHGTLCNLGIFIILVYSSPKHTENPRNTQNSVKHVSCAFSTETLCNTGIFRTQAIFRTLTMIYYGECYSEPYVTLVYLEPWHI